MTAPAKRLGRPPLLPDQRKGPTPVWRQRIPAELHDVLTDMHKDGSLEKLARRELVRRAAKAL